MERCNELSTRGGWVRQFIWIVSRVLERGDINLKVGFLSFRAPTDVSLTRRTKGSASILPKYLLYKKGFANRFHASWDSNPGLV